MTNSGQFSGCLVASAKGLWALMLIVVINIVSGLFNRSIRLSRGSAISGFKDVGKCMRIVLHACAALRPRLLLV